MAPNTAAAIKETIPSRRHWAAAGEAGKGVNWQTESHLNHWRSQLYSHCELLPKLAKQ